MPAPRCCDAGCTTPGWACRSARPAPSGSGWGPARPQGTVGPDRTHAGHHPHRPAGDARRRPDRLPDHARHRGPVGDELPLPRQARAVPGRERHAQPAQPADAARRRGPRRAQLVALHQRGDRPVRRRHRRRVRLAPLADLGHGRRREVDDRAARPLRLPARPDAAADEPGSRRQRDRGADRDATGARCRLAHPRLLRLGQPQRQGDLPALPRLVRRQPGAPLAAPARGRGQPVRRDHRRASTRPSPGPRSSPTPGTCASRPNWPATPCSPSPAHDAAKTLLADVFTRLGYGSECAHLAQQLPDRARRSSTARSRRRGSARPAWPRR